MSKYKIELKQTETFVIDVEAINEDIAVDIAIKKFHKMEEQGIEHYAGTGDGGLEVMDVYDVTNTDDPFDGGFDEIIDARPEDIDIPADDTYIKDLE